MKITDVQVFTVSGPYVGPDFPPGDRQAQQLDIYPEFNARGNRLKGVGAQYASFFAPAAVPAAQTAEQPPLRATYVEIQTDEGISGLWGPVQDFQYFFVLARLRAFLIGRDPLATELLYDQMIRMDRHGRSGMYMTAVSAVDCALWDLKGKAWGQPVYRLLGGPTRPAVPAYASMLGYSVEPEEAAQVAAEYRAQGFGAQKWFFRYGPGDGEAGMTQNLAMASAVREAVGEAYTLMFDAFMGWNLSYAAEMVRRLEPVRPFWMEEPVPPERVTELRKLREIGRVPIATGEHVYTRWQTKELLLAGAVDFLQNDPDWTGGITELTKIVALASSFETPLVAHGHSLLPALHVAGAQSPAAIPYVEYLMRGQPTKQNFHQVIYAPEQGEVRLPDLPGLGIVLDESKITQRTLVTL
ncbi:MAG: mandelate racemase/muconate lactonizing protein [Caldilineaceae bacterium]|nr:mandelate racemase/muconate lactonizing protein [Caldilineaceae bacterium]